VFRDGPRGLPRRR
jgi:hypothetical protein